MDSREKLEYLTIRGPAGPREIKVKGSRFIGFAYPAGNGAVADDLLAALAKKYRDATHICTACRFHCQGREVFRHDDNGEPGGTAGLPIYYEIKRRRYFNILVAVVRYFGGIKLGTGGLAKAYGTAARMVLEVAGGVSCLVRTRARVVFPYDFTGEMRRLMERYAILPVREDYRSDGIHMEISLPLMHREKVSRLLRKSSQGRIDLDEWS